MDNRYEKLERMRADIARDREKVDRLQELIRQKEAKLKEAEASRIVADVTEVDLTPEELGEFLTLIKSGRLDRFLSDATTFRSPAGTKAVTGLIESDDTEDDEDEDN